MIAGGAGGLKREVDDGPRVSATLVGRIGDNVGHHREAQQRTTDPHFAPDETQVADYRAVEDNKKSVAGIEPGVEFEKAPLFLRILAEDPADEVEAAEQQLLVFSPYDATVAISLHG